MHFSKFALLSVLYEKNANVKSANFNVKNENDKSANFNVKNANDKSANFQLQKCENSLF